MMENTKNKPARKLAGLSLVEVLVSMMIFALIAGGLSNLFVSTRAITLFHRHRIVAAELGRYFLDPLQMQVRQDQWGSNCLSTPGTNTNCNTAAVSIDGTDYTPEYVKSQIAGTEIRRLRLTIRWSEPSI